MRLRLSMINFVGTKSKSVAALVDDFCAKYSVEELKDKFLFYYVDVVEGDLLVRGLRTFPNAEAFFHPGDAYYGAHLGVLTCHDGMVAVGVSCGKEYMDVDLDPKSGKRTVLQHITGDEKNTSTPEAEIEKLISFLEGLPEVQSALRKNS